DRHRPRAPARPRGGRPGRRDGDWRARADQHRPGRARRLRLPDAPRGARAGARRVSHLPHGARARGRPALAFTRANAAETADLAAVENVRRHNIVDFVRRRTLLVPSRELRGPASVGADGVVTALFYDDEIAALAADEAGTFTPTDAPERRFTVERLADVAARWDRSTSRIRFRLVQSGAKQTPAPPPAGQAGWLELEPRPRQVLTVPASALLESPEGPYVLAWTGSGFNFEKRRIEIGETFLKQGWVVVLSGLRVNERVVGRATFFVEADRRAAAGGSAPESAL